MTSFRANEGNEILVSGSWTRRRVIHHRISISASFVRLFANKRVTLLFDCLLLSFFCVFSPPFALDIVLDGSVSNG